VDAPDENTSVGKVLSTRRADRARGVTVAVTQGTWRQCTQYLITGIGWYYEHRLAA